MSRAQRVQHSEIGARVHSVTTSTRVRPQGLDDGAARLQRMLSTDANGGRRPSHDVKEAAYQRRIAELEAQVRALRPDPNPHSDAVLDVSWASQGHHAVHSGSWGLTAKIQPP